MESDKEMITTIGEAFRRLGVPWLEENYAESLTLKSRTSVFNAAVTLWLMIVQKGIAGNSLASAVQHLKQGTSVDMIAQLVSKSKKFFFGEISNNPGGFSHARQRLPLEKVEAFADHISKRVEAEHGEDSKLYGYNAVVIDGSIIGLENSASIREEFPAQSNQHGEALPAARVVVAHNVVTGSAYRPEIGSIKDSEQALSHRLMKRLPKKTLMMGDRNFGVFSVVWHASQEGLVSVVRLQKERASVVAGKKEITQDESTAVTWYPSASECKKNGLPKDASVAGRFIAVTLEVPGRRAERFFFFTTATDLTPQQVLEIYKRRWFIETDLRSIKQTVNLDLISARSPAMAKKEIILGVVAYTLIRTVIARGAKVLNLQPREISFSRAREFVITIAIRLSKATTVKEAQITINSFIPGLRQLKLPNRKKFRTEPRAIVKNRRPKFPGMKGTRQEARQKEISRRMNGLTA